MIFFSGNRPSDIDPTEIVSAEWAGIARQAPEDARALMARLVLLAEGNRDLAETGDPVPDGRVPPDRLDTVRLGALVAFVICEPQDLPGPCNVRVLGFIRRTTQTSWRETIEMMTDRLERWHADGRP
ncbi:MAG: hypothetical protein R3D28_25875 [Geminicoccaceae bacterium]